MQGTKGYLIDVQNFSVNDGNGIRSLIFFAGCRLRCQWCSNPESFTNFNKVVHMSKQCLHCKRCEEVCPYGCGMDLNLYEHRKNCRNCGKCVPVCPVGARKNLIFTYTVNEIMKIIESQQIFFRHSKGGVTYSGGEATIQHEFLRELVNTCYDKAIHQAIETSGYFDFNQVRDILEKLDLIFLDIKHMDSKKHKYFTGVRNELILENIEKVASLNKEFVLRIPLIKGVNSHEENIVATAKFVRENAPGAKIEILPYHEFGFYKYEALGIQKPSERFSRPGEDEIKALKDIIEREGVEIASFV